MLKIFASSYLICSLEHYSCSVDLRDSEWVQNFGLSPEGFKAIKIEGISAVMINKKLFF